MHLTLNQFKAKYPHNVFSDIEIKEFLKEKAKIKKQVKARITKRARIIEKEQNCIKN